MRAEQAKCLRLQDFAWKLLVSHKLKRLRVEMNAKGDEVKTTCPYRAVNNVQTICLQIAENGLRVVEDA